MPFGCSAVSIFARILECQYLHSSLRLREHNRQEIAEIREDCGELLGCQSNMGDKFIKTMLAQRRAKHSLPPRQ